MFFWTGIQPSEILYGASDVGGIAVSVSAVSTEKGAIGLAGRIGQVTQKGLNLVRARRVLFFKLHQRIITAFTQSIQNRKALSSQPTLNIPATILRL